MVIPAYSTLNPFLWLKKLGRLLCLRLLSIGRLVVGLSRHRTGELLGLPAIGMDSLQIWVESSCQSALRFLVLRSWRLGMGAYIHRFESDILHGLLRTHAAAFNEVHVVVLFVKVPHLVDGLQSASNHQLVLLQFLLAATSLPLLLLGCLFDTVWNLHHFAISVVLQVVRVDVAILLVMRDVLVYLIIKLLFF